MGPISEAERYIVRLSGVRNGNAVVEGTRIGVHDVSGLLQNGETVDTLTANCFPQLTRSHVYECLAFYEDHPGGDRPSRGPPDGAGRNGVRFLLDHDVPEDLLLLKQLGHDATFLREALPEDASDESVLPAANKRKCVLVTCNRDDFLNLATRKSHPASSL
jgi:uncharacterized protein (DUF433 family)